MNTKTLLIAASTLAIAACGGAGVNDDRIETADAETGAATLASPEQPPLEGDSPFVDGADVADSSLDQENYDTGVDGTDLTNSELTDAEPDLDDTYGTTDTYATTDLDGNDEFLDDETSEFAATDVGTDLDGNDELLDVESTELATTDLDGNDEFLDDEGTELAAGTMTADQSMDIDDIDRSEPPVSDGVSAAEYTANNTDAVMEDGDLITGTEATMLSGTYDVELPSEVTVASGAPTLYIDGTGNQAVGTFAGEPIEVAVTGANFQFDAPVMMNGASELMTFTGTFEDGEISNGVIEAQGDGTTMDFSATRTGDAAADMEMDDADDGSF